MRDGMTIGQLARSVGIADSANYRYYGPKAGDPREMIERAIRERMTA